MYNPLSPPTFNQIISKGSIIWSTIILTFNFSFDKSFSSNNSSSWNIWKVAELLLDKTIFLDIFSLLKFSIILFNLIDNFLNVFSLKAFINSYADNNESQHTNACPDV